MCKNSLLKEEAEKFPQEGIPVRFINNPDTNRSASELSGDQARLKMAAALAASLPEAVLIYYGEEIGMPGEKGPAPYWDNYCREPIDWFASEQGDGQATWFVLDDGGNQLEDGISVEEQNADPNSLLNIYRKILTAPRKFCTPRGGNSPP